MTPEELQVPPTEIEVVELIQFVCGISDPPLRDVVRRLAFQRDTLLEEVARLKTELVEVEAFFQER